MLSSSVLATRMGMSLSAVRAVLGSSVGVCSRAQKGDQANKPEGDVCALFANATVESRADWSTVMYRSFYFLVSGGGTDDV